LLAAEHHQQVTERQQEAEKQTQYFRSIIAPELKF